jgi:hypothetical protein
VAQSRGIARASPDRDWADPAAAAGFGRSHAASNSSHTSKRENTSKRSMTFYAETVFMKENLAEPRVGR